MSVNETLIVYATKSGATEEYASMIEKVLRDKFGLEVDVVNLRKNKKPDFTPYSNVIIGSGVRRGKWYGEAKKFLDNDFGDRKVAIFLASRRAGTPEMCNEAVKNYITDVLAKHPHIKPVAAEAFGGIKKNKKERIILDLRDPAKAKTWTEELGKKLVK